MNIGGTRVSFNSGFLSVYAQRDGMGREKEGDSGWGTCVYLWRIPVDVWQNQYNIVK